MALQSLYDVLKEKEVQLQELQRLLNEAQLVLNRVLELDAAVTGSARASQAAYKAAVEGSAEEHPSNSWQANGSTEFP